MAPAILLALLLAAADPAQTPPPAAPQPLAAAAPQAVPGAAPNAAASDAGEPLPPGAPKSDYELAAWCYGAMSEYLDIYEKVKPDLRAIDRLFGSSVKNEAEPYAADMQAARDELKVLAGAVEAAEKASADPIAQRGVIAIRLGRSIWTPAEEKTRRELARAWLTWGLPDACDTRARALAANAKLLGTALTYNNPSAAAADAAEKAAPGQPPAAPADAPTEAPPQPSEPSQADPLGAAIASPPPPAAPPTASPQDR